MAQATETVDEASDRETEPKTSAEKRLGTLLAGSYRIKRLIGSGGSSHVFEAEHVRLAKSFAVKLLRPELDATRLTAQRFRREAGAIAKLQNEHIVSVIDCGELDDGTPYLVMELLEGEDLRSLLNREGALPARRAVQIVTEACRGLTAVHGAGLVHRDLKPENLFITRRSTGEDWCKVLDFGVAKMEASLSTAQGAIVGTVRYMAPEQLSDGASVGPATDVYSLGAILYECLSGEPLVDGGAVQEVMYRVMNAEPVPLRDLMPGANQELVGVIETCVAKSPSKRFSSTADLADKLLSTLARPLRVEPNDTWPEEDSSPPRAVVRSRRNERTGIVAGALALALGAGLGGWLLRGAPRLARPTSETPSKVLTANTGDASVPSMAENAQKPPPAAAPTPSMSAGRRPLRATKNPRAPFSASVAATAPNPTGQFDNTNPYGQ